MEDRWNGREKGGGAERVEAGATRWNGEGEKRNGGNRKREIIGVGRRERADN